MSPSRIQRFVVVGELGSGTMGTVYRARDPELERDVAIKVLARAAEEVRDALSSHDTVDLRGGGDASDELLSEARIMARLSHPNVLPVYEVGLANGQVFIVMEHIAGTDLRTWLETPRATGEILEMFAQATRGLESAHKRGIVHGDFKPENVLVGDDGRVRVADFGLSRLVSAQRPLLQLERAVGGTPFYMAPELWNGAPASASSDVFALCTAIVEALGAEPDKPGKRDMLDRALRVRGCDRQLRRAVLAGTAEDPAARPTIDALLAALAPRGRRRVVAGAAVAGGLSALVAAIAVSTSMFASQGPCAADAIRLDIAWNPSRIAALKAIELDDDFDKDRNKLSAAKRETCTAETTGEITAAQARMRASCLERLSISIDTAAQSIEALGNKERGTDAYLSTRGVAECKEITAPPVHADRARVAAIHLRLANAFAAPFGSEQRLREFAAVETEARALGDLDLAARATMLLGLRQIETDQLQAADESLGRAYRDAIAIHDRETALTALLKRAVAALRHGDAKGARSYGQLAIELAERPDASPELKTYVYMNVGQVELDLDVERALDLGEKALALIREHEIDDLPTERNARNIVIDALGQLGGGREVRALALAHENLEHATKHPREGYDDPLAISMNVVAVALRRNADPAGALVYRKRALDVMAKGLPADHSIVLFQRGGVALDMMVLGQFAAACAEFAELLVAVNHNAALRVTSGQWRADLGVCKFEQGHIVEGLQLYSKGVDEILAMNGPLHADSLAYRLDQLELEIEASQLDRAETHAEALAHDYRSSNKFPLPRARLEGVHRARLALARGRPAEAEQRARDGLSAWAELHGDETTRRELLRTLAQSLVAQHRWQDAMTAIDTASAIKAHARADDTAEIDIVRAQILAGQGRIRDARALARSVRATLESFPGALLARADADALLGKRTR